MLATAPRALRVGMGDPISCRDAKHWALEVLRDQGLAILTWDAAVPPLFADTSLFWDR